jgi:hypothetical protein
LPRLARAIGEIQATAKASRLSSHLERELTEHMLLSLAAMAKEGG